MSRDFARGMAQGDAEGYARAYEEVGRRQQMSTGMNNSDYVAPLREQDVAAMGLALGSVCSVKHRPGMKTHRHIELPESYAEPVENVHVTHACPKCGDVHLPPSSDTTG